MGSHQNGLIEAILMGTLNEGFGTKLIFISGWKNCQSVMLLGLFRSQSAEALSPCQSYPVADSGWGD